MKTVTALAVIGALFAVSSPGTDAEAKAKYRIKDTYKISCNTARHKVREMGFKTVKVKSCISTVYSFYAMRKGRTYIFYVHSRTGSVWRG